MPATVLGKRTRASQGNDETTHPSNAKKRAFTGSNKTGDKTNASKSGKKNVTVTPAKAIKAIARPGKQIKANPQQSPSRISTLLKSTKAQIEVYQDEKQDLEPTTPRHRDALSKKIAVTPRHRFIVGSNGTPRTPRTPSRSSTAIYAQARNIFTRSTNPGRLIGRYAEKAQLETFVNDRLRLSQGGCLYVSGPPGTGKSALVDEICTPFEATRNLEISSTNCMSVRTGQDLVKKLTMDLDLDDSTTMQDLRACFMDGQTKNYIVILDEVDCLVELDSALLCTLFEWSLLPGSRLTVIGIANALDLTDRCLPQLRSRGLKPELMPVLPYNASQIAHVLEQKLKALLPAGSDGEQPPPFFHPMALQFCAKKVAAQTGDLRKAFDICRRAIDLVEQEIAAKEAAALEDSPSKTPLMEKINLSSPPTPRSPSKDKNEKAEEVSHVLTVTTAPRATIAHMAKVTCQIFSNGAGQRLSTLNLQQKVVLCSLTALEKRKRAAELQRTMFATPSKSDRSAPSVKQLYDTYCLLCKRSEMLHPLSSIEFRDVVSGLETLGLLGGGADSGKNGSFALPITPSRTPSRKNRTGFGAAAPGMWDDKRLSNVLGEKEVRAVLDGPGGDLLREILDGDCL